MTPARNDDWDDDDDDFVDDPDHDDAPGEGEESLDDACEPCPECGCEIYDDAPLCPRCGAAVIRRTDGGAWRGRPWWWVALAVVGIVVVLASMLLFPWPA